MGLVSLSVPAGGWLSDGQKKKRPVESVGGYTGLPFMVCLIAMPDKMDAYAEFFHS